MIRIRFHLYKITFIIVLIFCSTLSNAQVIIGANGVGMGQATVALPDNTWAIFTNPALIREDNISLGFYSLRNYGVSELTDIAAVGAYPTKFGLTAFAFHRYGDNLFNETRIRLAYANKWKDLRFGIALNYNSIIFGGPYGSGSALGMDVGLAAQLSEDLWLGARGTNINRPSYNGINEDLPRELAIGLSYRLEEIALFSFDVVKDVRFEKSFRGGVEMKIVENLKGRVGISSQPNTYSFGLGYGQERWEINIAFQRHELLGVSPGLDLNFFF